jgi:hypothetical protein
MSAPDFPRRSFVLLPFASFLENISLQINHSQRVSSKVSPEWLPSPEAHGDISVTAILETAALTGSLLAKSRQLWPVSQRK